MENERSFLKFSPRDQKLVPIQFYNENLIQNFLHEALMYLKILILDFKKLKFLDATETIFISVSKLFYVLRLLYRKHSETKCTDPKLEDFSKKFNLSNFRISPFTVPRLTFFSDELSTEAHTFALSFPAKENYFLFARIPTHSIGGLQCSPRVAKDLT